MHAGVRRCSAHQRCLVPQLFVIGPVADGSVFNQELAARTDVRRREGNRRREAQICKRAVAEAPAPDAGDEDDVDIVGAVFGHAVDAPAPASQASGVARLASGGICGSGCGRRAAEQSAASGVVRKGEGVDDERRVAFIAVHLVGRGFGESAQSNVGCAQGHGCAQEDERQGRRGRGRAARTTSPKRSKR